MLRSSPRAPRALALVVLAATGAALAGCAAPADEGPLRVVAHEREDPAIVRLVELRLTPASDVRLEAGQFRFATSNGASVSPPIGRLHDLHDGTLRALPAEAKGGRAHVVALLLPIPAPLASQDEPVRVTWTGPQGEASANLPPAKDVPSRALGEDRVLRSPSMAPSLLHGDHLAFSPVGNASEVETFVEGGPARFGRPGDVVAYRVAGTGHVIVHRAVAYVEVEKGASGASYRVRWAADAPCETPAAKEGSWCVYGEEGIHLKTLGLEWYHPHRSGFLTQGDNPFLNPRLDQEVWLSRDETGRPSPVDLAWIDGKVASVEPRPTP